jgi:hypothetical protein
MYEDVIERLKSLGYEVNELDDWLLRFEINAVTQTIKNECNVTEVPDGLHFVAVDMICGKFLFAKKGSGQLDGFDVEAAAKSIKEGDTQVTYAISDTSITLDGLIGTLISAGKSQFTTYRRFAW